MVVPSSESLTRQPQVNFLSHSKNTFHLLSERHRLLVVKHSSSHLLQSGTLFHKTLGHHHSCKRRLKTSPFLSSTSHVPHLSHQCLWLELACTKDIWNSNNNNYYYLPYILAYMPTIFGWILRTKLWGSDYMRVIPHSHTLNSQSQHGMDH